MKTENAWKKYADKTEVFAFCEAYKDFISSCKTERECVTEMVQQAEKAGYRNIDAIIESGETLKAGDKVYANNKGKDAGFVSDRRGTSGKRYENPGSAY